MTARAEWTAYTATPAPGPHTNRTLPSSEGEGGGSGSVNSLNLIFIVGLAVVITFLARYLSGRGRRK